MHYLSAAYSSGKTLATERQCVPSGNMAAVPPSAQMRRTRQGTEGVAMTNSPAEAAKGHLRSQHLEAPG